MDRDRLTRLIDDPAGVQREDITDLKVMAERYPWFSGAHLLLAVGGHREGDVLFDEQLRTSAAHLPSRAVLFDMIHVPVVPEQQPELVRSLDPTPAELFVEEPGALEEPVPERSVAENQPTVAPAANEPAPPLLPPEATAVGSVDALDKQIRDAAVASSYELLIEHTPTPEPPAPAPTVEQAPLIPEPVPVPDAAASLAPVTGRMRFSDWLSAGETAQPLDAPIASPVPAASPEDPGSSDTRALIAQFVQQSQSARTKKAEFFNPQQAAKRSLEDHADLVTETLARIYEKQGNFNKAVLAYKRLAMKHPERADHFLSQARILEGGAS